MFQYDSRAIFSRGGIFSVALSPDYSGPPLAATLSYGVRTFLSPPPLFTAEGSDRLIRFSPTSLSLVSSFITHLQAIYGFHK